ncbi:MAG: antitoxin Xre/MbcA/ParS toxin-binding domain-containing protein [Bryobacteraceae bacterium]
MRTEGESARLDGTLQLPDGRQIPVVVTVNVEDLLEHDKAFDSLLLRAVEAFGKTEKALSWLTTPNSLFENRAPREVALTEGGRAAVLNTLLDLEHGFPA